METIKLLAFIFLIIYFLLKLYASVIACFKYKLKDIQKVIPSIQNKNLYYYGIIEHLFFLILVILLYII